MIFKCTPGKKVFVDIKIHLCTNYFVCSGFFFNCEYGDFLDSHESFIYLDSLVWSATHMQQTFNSNVVREFSSTWWTKFCYKLDCVLMCHYRAATAASSVVILFESIALVQSLPKNACCTRKVNKCGIPIPQNGRNSNAICTSSKKQTKWVHDFQKQM